MQPDEGLFTRQLPGDRFREQTDPVLQLENINVSFDGFRALTDLSLAIGVGELRCVIGPNGAGKTTLMDVITGKTRPQSGKALYDQSVDLTTLDPVAIARQGIGRKFQKPTVFEALTVAENLALAMKRDKSVWASLRARMSSEQDDRLNEVLRLLRLDGERYRQAGLLSHGQKQFLEIGMLLVQEPHLLLLDEPAAGMTDAETGTPGGAVSYPGWTALPDGGGARHGICRDHRRPGDGPASGPGAGGGIAAGGTGQ